MTDHTRLERRYRRWLSLYPTSFRADHEEEMIAVLMQAAAPGQRHPRPAQAADLATHALHRRAGRLPGTWERAHARIMFPLRIAIAGWLCFISAMLIGFDRGQTWLALLIPAIALHIYIAYQIRPGTPQR